MPILCDYHMHTPLCKHAAGPMEAYVERGIELGLQEIGFADHNPLPGGRSANVRMAEAELDYYVERVTELRFRYRGKIDVMLGLEIDYIQGLEDYVAEQIAAHPWDYVIGSIHFLDNACREPSWPRQYPGDRADGSLVRRSDAVRGIARPGLPRVPGHRVHRTGDQRKRGARAADRRLLQRRLDRLDR